MEKLKELLEMYETVEEMITEEIKNLTVAEYNVLAESGVLNEISIKSIGQGAKTVGKNLSKQSKNVFNNIKKVGKVVKNDMTHAKKVLMANKTAVGVVGAVPAVVTAKTIYNKLKPEEKMTFKKAMNNCKSNKNPKGCVQDLVRAWKDRV